MKTREHNFNHKRKSIKAFKKTMKTRRKWLEESKTENQVTTISKSSRFYKLIKDTNY